VKDGETSPDDPGPWTGRGRLHVAWFELGAGRDRPGPGIAVGTGRVPRGVDAGRVAGGIAVVLDERPLVP